MRSERPFASAALVLLLATVVAACSGSAAPTTSAANAASASPSAAGSRPTSSATVSIVSPKANEVVTGTALHVVIALTGGTIVSATTTNVRPDQGHLHLYLDNNLVSMNYGTEQDVPVTPGTYVIKAEYVAADHAPFNPRVWSPEVVFTVK